MVRGQTTSGIELWSAESWSAYNGGSDESIEDLAKELAEIGLL